MQFHFYSLIVLTILPILANTISRHCANTDDLSKYNFYPVKLFYRSVATKLHVDNVDSLEACIEMAKYFKGLALNFSSRRQFAYRGTLSTSISRDHYWQQPQLYFNCHILQCPENSTSKTLIHDTSFDYYSMYEDLIDIPNYICVPQVGLFLYHNTAETFQNASLRCKTSSEEYRQCGSLAHIASEHRTSALAQILVEHNQRRATFQAKTNNHLAYVGLYFNSSRSQRFQLYNMDGNNLQCFTYRAWGPGNPKMSSDFSNSSCVAVTSDATWITVDCRRKLSYFCEILTKCEDEL